MAASDMIRVSTDTLEDLQARLRTLQGRIGSEAGAVQALAGRIDQACGANVAVSIKLPGQGTANNVQAALDACVRALRLCSEESLRIRSAVGGASSLFLQNERELTRSFNGENIGVSGEDVLPEGATQPLMGTAAGGTWLDWLKQNYPEFAQLFETLANLGADGVKLYEYLKNAVKMMFNIDLPSDMLKLFSQPASDVLQSSLGQALFGNLSALDVVSFIASVGADLASDISKGLPADRIICNAVANTLVSAVVTVGGAVGGDLLAKGLGAAVSAIPGLQAVGPLVATVTSPLLQVAVTHGIDALVNMKIGDQTVTQYVQDFVYNAYKGAGEAVEFAKETFNYISDCVQTGAEMIWDGVQDAGEAIAEGWENTKEAVQDGLDAMRDMAQDGLEKAQEFFDNGWDFIRDSASWLIA